MVLSLIPFSYLWSLKKLIGKDINSVLDLGCGNGVFMGSLSENEDWQITGIDIFSDQIKRAQKLGIYKKLLKSEIETSLKTYIKEKKKFDLIFCSQVLEHLSRKKGQSVLQLMEKVASKKIVITTPRGYIDQYDQFIEKNPYQIHKSGWSVDEFTSRGFEVYGVGIKYIWSKRNLTWRKNYFKKYLYTIFSFIISPLIFYFPNLATGLICVKDIEVK